MTVPFTVRTMVWDSLRSGSNGSLATMVTGNCPPLSPGCGMNVNWPVAGSMLAPRGSARSELEIQRGARVRHSLVDWKRHGVANRDFRWVGKRLEQSRREAEVYIGGHLTPLNDYGAHRVRPGYYLIGARDHAKLVVAIRQRHEGAVRPGNGVEGERAPFASVSTEGSTDGS